MGYLILGIIILAAILVLGGYIVLSVMNAAMWMDDSMRWGGRCELADFHIEGRVVLKDKRTGKVWR